MTSPFARFFLRLVGPFDAARRVHTSWHRTAGALALLAGVTLASPLRAECAFDSGDSTGTYNVALPATITVPFNTAIGATIATSSSTPISRRVDFHCSGSGNRFGVENKLSGSRGTGNSLYETDIDGVGYRVLEGGDYLFPYPARSLDGSYGWSESDLVVIELVKTGPINQGAMLRNGQFALFKAGASRAITVAALKFANSVTFVSPACRLDTPSITVKLPNVSTSAFPAIGSIGGATRFQIALTCNSGALLDVTFATATPAGPTGVIKPASGSTGAGVGVQLIDDAFAPVVFGSTTTVGATPSGTLTVPYYARYYRTGTVIPGSINATATFTLTYR